MAKTSTSSRPRRSASKSHAGEGTPTRSKSNVARRRRRRRESHKKAAVRASTIAAAEVKAGVDPDDALQNALDRAVAWMEHAAAHVEQIDDEDFWRDTLAGRIPHEWVRFERDMRHEVINIAQRMVGLGIEGRRADAAEALAEALGPVFAAVFSELKLTARQRQAAPQAITQGLRVLEGKGEELA